MPRNKIAVDFDGVINSYVSGWTGKTDLPDLPVPGAFQWLEEISKSYGIIIHTARFEKLSDSNHKVILALDAWFRKHGLSEDVLRDLQYWTDPGKPKAVMYVDDRAYRFVGDNFPSVDVIANLRPWGEK